MTVYLDDLIRYDLDQKTWTQVVTSGNNPPAARFGHTITAFDGYAYLFGGYDKYGLCCDEMHMLNLSDHAWVLLNVPAQWKGLIERYHHTAVPYRRSLFVFGGKNLKSFCKEQLLEFHVDTKDWSVISTIGSPPTRRCGHCACVVQNSMYVTGGREENRQFSLDTFEYQFESRTWRKIEVSSPPTGREFASSWVFDGKLHILGGQSAGQSFNDVYRLRSSDDVASDLSSSNLDDSGRSGNFISKSDGSRRGSAMDESDSLSTRETLRLKCHHFDEIRILCVDRKILYREFLEQLFSEYSYLSSSFPLSPSSSSSSSSSSQQNPVQTFRMFYRDEDGDMITVRSESDFEVMKDIASLSLKAGVRVFKLYLSDPDTISSPAVQHIKSPKSGFSVSQMNRSTSPLLSGTPSLLKMNSPSPKGTPELSRISWTKGELLGRGAYGNVYLGMTSSGELIAVKEVTLLSSSKEAAQALESLQREITLLQSLCHPHIVRYLGSELVEPSLTPSSSGNHALLYPSSSQRVLNIFLEYVSGGSIHSLLQKFGPFQIGVVRSFIGQVLDGLVYLHDNGIVHRDIKGANVLVDSHGQVKLADFGASKQLSSVKSISNGGCNTFTGVRVFRIFRIPGLHFFCFFLFSSLPIGWLLRSSKGLDRMVQKQMSGVLEHSPWR